MSDRTPSSPIKKNELDKLNDAARKTAEYLYSIDPTCPDEFASRIATLRQLINEEYIGKNRTISSQFIYDILKPAISKSRSDLLREVEKIIDICRQEYIKNADTRVSERMNSSDMALHIQDLQRTALSKLEEAI